MTRARGFISIGLAIELGVGALALAGTAWVTHGLTARSYEARIAKTAQEARERADVQAESDRLAGRAYEAWRTAQQRKATHINREIDHALQENREWADRPLPDSVRQSLERAATELGAVEPDSTVPAVREPTTPD